MTTTRNTVAQTIADQIGHGAFMMLGAKDILDCGDALQFKIRGSKAVNVIVVTLDADDTYTVTFQKMARSSYAIKTVAEVSSVHADSLRSVIERNTGLYTSL